MGDFPTTNLTKADLDAGTDSPADARTELVALVDKVNEIIASYAVANGLCDLDASGLIPVSRLPSGGDADTLDGQHGSYYLDAGNMATGTLPALRFADSTHGNRSGGGLHAAATTSSAGFMSAADKQDVNNIYSTATSAAQSTSNVRIATKGLGVFDVGSYLFAKNEEDSTKYPGSTVSGSYLVPAALHLSSSGDVGWNEYNSSVPGTWRCMGYASSVDRATLWLRVA